MGDPLTEANPRYKWWIILMLWSICFLNYADRQSIFAVFPEIERQFHFKKEQLGLIGSAFMWVYASASVFAGMVCDRFRRKDLILGGCLFWSLATAATGMCVTLHGFMAVRALAGLGETFYFPASLSLASDYHRADTRSRAIALHQTSVYAGVILGSWGGAWMATKFGWPVGFYVFGGLGVLLSLVLYRTLREPRRGAADGPAPAGSDFNEASTLGRVETFRTIFQSPQVPLLMLAFAAANSVAAIFLVWAPSFLKDKFHYSLTMAGLGGSVFVHLASAISVPIAGWLADRWTKRIETGRILVQAAGLTVGAVFVFQVGRARDSASLLGSMILFGLCKGFYDSGIFTSIYDSIDPRARGTATGLMNTVGWGGGALGPWMVGWLADHGHLATPIENMSQAISRCGIVYWIAAVLLGMAAASKGIRKNAVATRKETPLA